LEYFLNFDKYSYVSGNKPEGCILCLLKDKADCVQNLCIYEDELIHASVNLYPYNPGHLLLYPARHLTDIRQLNDAENMRLIEVQNGLLNILDELYKPHAYNIGYNMGLTAGASIEHLHLHIIPRYPREIGIADLISGKHVLVESPFESLKRLKNAVQKSPLSRFIS
jgi:ATP adenylyltransferase